VVIFKPLQVLFKASRLGKIATRAGAVAAESAGSVARLMSQLAQEVITGGARGFEAVVTRISATYKPLHRSVWI
jgi:hypothetical protein